MFSEAVLTKSKLFKIELEFETLAIFVSFFKI